MTCTEFQRILPEMIDGQAEGEHAAHLRSCTNCSSLVADLQAITQGALQLRAADDPSPRIWANIQRSLEAEGLIHVPQQPGGIFVPSKGTRSSWAWITVVATVFVALGLVLTAKRPTSPSEVAKNDVQMPRVAVPATAGPAEDDQQLLAEISPYARSAYEDNLKSVNAFIQDAEQSVAQNPDDDEARHFLMDAYRQRELVYQLAMDRSVQ